MRFDLQRLDDRIKKLHEIRRIAADPEMANILLEFLTPQMRQDYGVSEPAPAPRANGNGTPLKSEEADDLINDVVNGIDAHPTGGGLWHRKDR
jgi:hypothetical protein